MPARLAYTATTRNRSPKLPSRAPRASSKYTRAWDSMSLLLHSRPRRKQSRFLGHASGLCQAPSQLLFVTKAAEHAPQKLALDPGAFRNSSSELRASGSSQWSSASNNKEGSLGSCKVTLLDAAQRPQDAGSWGQPGQVLHCFRTFFTFGRVSCGSRPRQRGGISASHKNT